MKLTKKQQGRLASQWASVDQVLIAMQKDAQVCSLIDIEVGVFGLLRLMNEVRTDHNVRPMRLSDASLGKLCEAAREVEKASMTVGTSTAVQTATVGLMKTLMEAEMRQDEERLPEIVAALQASCDANGRVIKGGSVGFAGPLWACGTLGGLPAPQF